MIKLNYTGKRIITSLDLYDPCEPMLTFEVKTRPPREWTILYRDFEEGGATDPIAARRLIAMAFFTVSDGEATYPLNTVEAVCELEQSAENVSPGYGVEFICNLAWAFGRNHYVYLTDYLGNSGKPLAQSNGIAEAETAKVS